MEQIRAVNKKMGSIKLEEQLPHKYLWYMRECLMEMWVVGWEHGRFELNERTRKPIIQINCDGKVINQFKSQRDASRKTHVPWISIWRSLNNNKPVKGYTWKYVELEENEF